jgi:cytochrome c-type biogenesis protein CcmH/NrfF
MIFRVPLAWGVPNGSLKSFIYKMVYNPKFRIETLLIWSFGVAVVSLFVGVKGMAG